MIAYRELPEVSREAYVAIAEDWAGHLPRGPAQVTAILLAERLKRRRRVGLTEFVRGLTKGL